MKTNERDKSPNIMRANTGISMMEMACLQNSPKAFDLPFKRPCFLAPNFFYEAFCLTTVKKEDVLPT